MYILPASLFQVPRQKTGADGMLLKTAADNPPLKCPVPIPLPVPPNALFFDKDLSNLHRMQSLVSHWIYFLYRFSHLHQSYRRLEYYPICSPGSINRIPHTLLQYWTRLRNLTNFPTNSVPFPFWAAYYQQV